jgi:hypothetical protein
MKLAVTSMLGPKLLLFTTALLVETGCFDQSTRVPEAVVVAGSANSCADRHEVFVEAGDMQGSRADHTATVLSDGRVLMAGGYSSLGMAEHALLDSSEVYDPSDRSFRETGKMTSLRSEAAATRLPDGRVLISGGFDQGRWVGLGEIARVPINTTEIFDPKSNGLTVAAPMRKARYAHSSLLLENGKVLIAGGSCQAEGFMGVASGGACSPELYDPTKGTFSFADTSGAAHNEEDAVVLADGKVLLFCAGTHAEIYDPQSGRFTPTGEMPERMDSCSGMLLNDKRVLVFGTTRIASTKREVPRWPAQIYDPTRGSFSWLKDPPLEIADPTLVSVDGNRVLISGTVNPDYENILSSEMFDAGRNDFSVVGAQHPHRSGFTATRLADGTVLIAGGAGDSLPYSDRRAVLFCP